MPSQMGNSVGCKFCFRRVAVQGSDATNAWYALTADRPKDGECHIAQHRQAVLAEQGEVGISRTLFRQCLRAGP